MALAYSRYLFGFIPWYSVLISLGIALAYLVGLREEKRMGLPKDTMTNATLVAVPCGILGSRIYYVALEWRHFADNPLRILYLWEGGVAIYGAVLGGAIGVFLYSRKKKISFAKLADIIAPGLLLAQAVGRWGNYFNREAYGLLLINPAQQWFPLGVLIPENGGLTWHAATFFYEFLWNLAAFLVLMGLRKRQKRDGNVFLWYLTLYGSGRYIIEQLRTDSLWIGSLRASEALSLVFCVLSACLLLWRACLTERRAVLAPAALLAAAVSRWFLAGQTFYGLPLIVIMALIICRALWRGRRESPLPPAALWILLPWTLDAAGYLLAQARIFTLSYALQLFLSSVTFPCYLLWLLKRLSKGDPENEPAPEKETRPHGTPGRSPCP